MNDASPKRDLTPRGWLSRAPLSSLRQEMDQMFENFLSNTGLTSGSTDRLPSIDVSETASAVEVKTDLPGFKPDDVSIELRDGYLVISGETTEEKRTEDEKDRRYHRIERRQGSFSRSVLLPCEVHHDGIDAELKDGVLTVKLPKAPGSTSKKISIKGT
ncbi:MAG: Hsp20/alpha crystallin family protein [Planctomycetaceae bacterium]|nr:Hsp20/alpha crystallin family protein [Planctomycetaceae bacterium]